MYYKPTLATKVGFILKVLLLSYCNLVVNMLYSTITVPFAIFKYTVISNYPIVCETDQILNVRNIDKNKTYTMCPKCFKYEPLLI